MKYVLYQKTLLAIVACVSILPGVDLEYVTFVGGSGEEKATSVWGDASGRAHVLGSTTSANLQTTAGVVQPSCGSNGLCNGDQADLFVGRLSANGSRFEFLTYLGASRTETAGVVRTDGLGNVLLTGRTESPDFPFSADLFGNAAADRTGLAAGAEQKRVAPARGPRSE